MADRPTLDVHTVMQCAPDLVVHIEFGTPITIAAAGNRINAARHALRILEAFSHPRPVAQMIDALQGSAASVQAWIDPTSTIVVLSPCGRAATDRRRDG